ncbi:conserved hypothetical protein [Bradyrhizobium sp. ORS 278]|uniref:hypothetical protein n=1 Tax=Bradyrhizobium sp. (strain ORS 278) TaxID=114615 RepID=UPI0001508A81|nr:hypothetical protein [Bradyrhizobium sp. ORS 278]CAL77651.1 conserved hypothetical protein [Bradyrhizobium sp. ORS 278]
MSEVGRVAFREEGSNWNAYYAMSNTMDHALYLGTIKLALVANRQRKTEFIELMQKCVADVVEELYGVRPTFPPESLRAAPEHERSSD